MSPHLTHQVPLEMGHLMRTTHQASKTKLARLLRVTRLLVQPTHQRLLQVQPTLPLLQDIVQHHRGIRRRLPPTPPRLPPTPPPPPSTPLIWKTSRSQYLIEEGTGVPGTRPLQPVPNTVQLTIFLLLLQGTVPQKTSLRGPDTVQLTPCSLLVLPLFVTAPPSHSNPPVPHNQDIAPPSPSNPPVPHCLDIAPQSSSNLLVLLYLDIVLQRLSSLLVLLLGTLQLVQMKQALPKGQGTVRQNQSSRRALQCRDTVQLTQSSQLLQSCHGTAPRKRLSLLARRALTHNHATPQPILYALVVQ